MKYLAMLMALTSPAFGCQTLNEVGYHLYSEYGEVPQWSGRLNSDLFTVYVFTNEDTGTWSFVYVDNTNAACVHEVGNKSVVWGE